MSSTLEMQIRHFCSVLVLALLQLSVATYQNNFALKFDGKDDTVLISHLLRDGTLPDSSWTLEAWVRPDEDASYNQVAFFVCPPF